MPGRQEIVELQKKRFQVLSKLYDAYNEKKETDIIKVGEELGLDKNLTVEIYSYLKNEKLIGRLYNDTLAKIAHGGIVEVEELVSNPNKKTTHFPSLREMEL